jgi:phospholipase D1/2
VIAVIPAIPGFAGDLRSDPATGTRAIMDYQYKSICRGENSIKEQIRKQGVNPDDHIFFFNLRSYDRLHKTPAMKRQEEKAGVDYKDVQKAQAQEIMGGKTGEDSDDEKQEEQRDQKRRFEEQKEQADSEGKHTENEGKDNVGQDVMAHQDKLSSEEWEGDPEGEKAAFIQEELYIHGKVLIADDKVVICGSSNLNDRSQMGTHDSELSIVMQDRKVLNSTMDGAPYKAGHHAATLRRMLWREHLGLLDPQELDGSKDPNCEPVGDSPNDCVEDDSFEFVADPLSDEVWNMWTKNATTNTEIFRELFHADPDDSSK